jgi:DNA-binding transcriptional ArsR family regulator
MRIERIGCLCACLRFIEEPRGALYSKGSLADKENTNCLKLAGSLILKTNPMSDVSREIEILDAVFAALAHRTRRRILVLLRSRGGTLAAGEIAESLSCAWPTTTRHLHVLESAGLVGIEKSGRERMYRLESNLLLQVTRKWLRWFEEGV